MATQALAAAWYVGAVRFWWLALVLGVVVACGDATPTPTSPAISRDSPASPHGSSASPRDKQTPGESGDATPTPNSPAGSRDKRIPSESGDYSGALADAEAYKQGKISFELLTKRVVARKLPPHKLGCGYLLMDTPMPPPGVTINHWMMPKDWEHNFGEIAITMWVGMISLDEYHRLHEAAHPGESKK